MANSQIQVDQRFEASQTRPQPSPPPRRHGPIRALVLLGGSVRPNELTKAISRSVLDLPVDEHGSVLDQWQRHAEQLVHSLQLQQLSIELLIDRRSPSPHMPAKSDHVDVHVQHDPQEYRGTGGLLRDLAQQFDDDDHVLVASAAQILLEPLTELADALADGESDVRLISHDHGTPSGLMLARCGALRSLPADGFVDMKEQALPRIAAQHRVTVVNCPKNTGLPIATLAGYIHAVRVHHLQLKGAATQDNPLAEDWQTAFSLVDDPESVHESARVHDSVVLRGGRVDSGAVLVRSIVCSNGVLRRNQTAVDTLVNGRTA